jgi:tetratricopeptide (TPR) repeat protein
MNPETVVMELNQAQQLFTEGNLEGAIRVYRRVIENDPHNKTAYYGLGESFAKLGQLEDAIRAYRQAIQLVQQQKHTEDAIARYRHRIEENPDSISEYYKLLELEPDNQEVLLKLAETLVGEGKLEDAIALYRRLVELSPCEEYYQQLGALLVKKEKWDEAIIAYQRAIDFNPEAYQYHYQLGEAIYARVMQNPESFFVEYKIAEFPHKEYQLFSPELPELCLLNDEKFTQATSHLDDETYVIELYRVYLRREPSNFEKENGINWLRADHTDRLLGLIASRQELPELQSLLRHSLLSVLSVSLEEAIACFRRTIELNPYYCEAQYYLGEVLAKQGKLNESAATYYQLSIFLSEQGRLDEAVACFQKAPQMQTEGDTYDRIWRGLNQLGTLLVKQEKWEDAISCYRRVIEINPTHYDTYIILGELLTQNRKINEASRIYHKLSIILSEKGYINQAIAAFKKAPQRESRPGEVYENIWHGLNQLMPLDSDNAFYPTDIKLEEAYEYLSKVSHYKLLKMQSLTDEQKRLLEDSGLSIGNLELMREDNLALEEIYINNFNNSSHPIQLQLAKQVDRDVTNMLWHTCPSRIKFQQSIVETGYIYSVCPRSGKIIRSNQSIMYNSTIFYRFVGIEVFYLNVPLWQGDKFYLYFPRTEIIIDLRNEEHGINIIDFINGFKGFCVSQWKLLIDYLSNTQKEIVSLTGLWGNLGHYFWNEITGIEYLRKNGILAKIDCFLVGCYDEFNVSDIFPEIPGLKVIKFENNTECSQLILKNNYFAVRVTDIFIKKSLSDLIHQMALKKCSQEFLQKVEEAAKSHIPLLWINLRSHSKSWLSQVEGYANIINTLHKDYPNIGIVFDGFSDEQDIMESIINLIPPTVRTYNGLNCLLYETIVWAYAVDLYIAVLGSGLTLVTWLANKPGVAHSNVLHCGQQCWWSTVRENAIAPNFVPPELIIDQEPSHPYCNYDLDWKIIYSEVKRITENLPGVELIKK